MADGRSQMADGRARTDRHRALPSAIRHLPSMLTDLDLLMRARAIDTVVVPMHEAMHSSFRWLSRGAKVTRGYAIKRVDRDPLLVTYPMEREEAAATGLEVRLASALDHERIFKTATHIRGASPEIFATS